MANLLIFRDSKKHRSDQVRVSTSDWALRARPLHCREARLRLTALETFTSASRRESLTRPQTGTGKPAPDCSRAAPHTALQPGQAGPEGYPAGINRHFPTSFCYGIDIFPTGIDILRQESATNRHVSWPWDTWSLSGRPRHQPSSHRWNRGIPALRHPAIASAAWPFAGHPWAARRKRARR